MGVRSLPKPIAWKRRRRNLDLLASGGHHALFPRQRIYPVKFPMRHYLFLSYVHGIEKYCKRAYAPGDKEKDFNVERRLVTRETFQLLSLDFMKRKTKFGELVKTDPRTEHPNFVYPD